MRDVPSTSRSRLVPATALTATLVLILGGVSAASAHRRDGSGDRARAQNVILFIGDGMGVSHRTAGSLATVGLDGELVMDGLRHSGLLTTDPADPEALVTDSAAAGTALATGVRTYNGAIGVDAGGRPVQTVVERAEAAGLSTGLVTTGEVTDATTAAFGAHVPDRGRQTEIARQFIEERASTSSSVAARTSGTRRPIPAASPVVPAGATRATSSGGPRSWATSTSPTGRASRGRAAASSSASSTTGRCSSPHRSRPAPTTAGCPWRR